MKALLLLAAAAAALALPGGRAGADPRIHAYREAGALVEDCVSEAVAIRARCLGYLVGVADALEGRPEARAGRGICIPAVVDVEQARVALLRYAEAQPQALSRTSFEIVRAVLAATWPCR